MNNLRTPSPTITDATLLFKDIVKSNSMSNITISGWDKNVTLPYMMEKRGWIGTLMLKSDEVAAMLFGCRLWDVAYTADKNTVDGIMPVDMSDKSIHGRNVDTYMSFPNHKPGDFISKAMMYLICQHTFKTFVKVNDGAAEISPVVGFYDIKGELSHGDILPFPSQTILSTQFLNKFICDLNVSKVLEKTKDNLDLDFPKV